MAAHFSTVPSRAISAAAMEFVDESQLENSGDVTDTLQTAISDGVTTDSEEEAITRR